MDNFLALFECVGALARRRYQFAERYFSALGLNHTEARLLTLLDREGGAAAQDALSMGLIVDRTNAGRALKRLEAAGYVVRRKAADDKRANLVRMTAKGRRAVAEISKLRRKMAKELFAGMTADEAGAAFQLLEKAVGKEFAGAA